MAGDARLLFVLIGFAACLLTASLAQPAEVEVGLFIDADSPVGKIATTTIPMALEDFYAAFPNSISRVKNLQHNSSADVVVAASAALQLMTTQGARAILGPQSSVESAFVATQPKSVASAAMAEKDTTGRSAAIAALATLFGWRRVVPIYQDDDYGAALVPFLVEALASARAEVPYNSHVHAHNHRSRRIADVLFFHDMLRPGTMMTPTIPPTSSLPPLLPRRVANSIPFSANRYPDIVTMHVRAGVPRDGRRDAVDA